MAGHLVRKTKIASLEPQTLQFVSQLGRTVRSPFDADVLIGYERRRRHYLLDVLPKLSSLARNQESIGSESLNVIYGLSKDHHSFDAPTLDWGFGLTEPQATKTIAHLLNKGSGDVRALRIIAFFRAMKSAYIPTAMEAQSAFVEAEKKGATAKLKKNRIDLVLKYKKEGGQKYSALIIEAKFDHMITESQLKNYREIVKADRSIEFKQTHWVILGFDYSAMMGLKGLQGNVWRFVAWRDLWLRFEKERPVEDDPNLTIFLKWLWRRIGKN